MGRASISNRSATTGPDAHQTETSVAISLGDLLRHAVILVHLLHDVLGEVALAELIHALEQHLLLIGQIEVHLLSLARVLPDLRDLPGFLELNYTRLQNSRNRSLCRF